MSKITQSARNEECQVRLIGICNHNSETTVFAHYRKGGLGGMGKKPKDISALMRVVLATMCLMVV